MSTNVDEKYFYLEVCEPPRVASQETVPWPPPNLSHVFCSCQGQETAEGAYRECKQKEDGDHHTLVRCEVKSVVEQVTMYVHVNFPKDKFSAADLANLERSGAKVTATLSQDGAMVNEVSTPLLSHWRDEL